MSDKKAPGIMIYFDTVSAIELLSVEEKGALFSAILHYGMENTNPVFDPWSRLAVVWEMIRPRIDVDKEKYMKKCEQNRLNALKRSHASECD